MSISSFSTLNIPKLNPEIILIEIPQSIIPRSLLPTPPLLGVLGALAVLSLLSLPPVNAPLDIVFPGDLILRVYDIM